MEAIKLIINYLCVSLGLLMLFSSGIIDLYVPEKHEKYKDGIIIFMCLFWLAFIATAIVSIFYYIKGGKDK